MKTSPFSWLSHPVPLSQPSLSPPSFSSLRLPRSYFLQHLMSSACQDNKWVEQTSTAMCWSYGLLLSYLCFLCLMLSTRKMQAFFTQMNFSTLSSLSPVFSIIPSVPVLVSLSLLPLAQTSSSDTEAVLCLWYGSKALWPQVLIWK